MVAVLFALTCLALHSRLFLRHAPYVPLRQLALDLCTNNTPKRACGDESPLIS